MLTPVSQKEAKLKGMDILMLLGFIFSISTLSFVLGVNMGEKKALEAKREKGVEIIHSSDFGRGQGEGIYPEEGRSSMGADQDDFDLPELEEGVDDFPESFLEEGENEPREEALGIQRKDQIPEDIPFIGGENSRYTGQYTIVLGEFLDIEDANLFAQAFKERGYRPFLQKKSKMGLDRIRVSIGNFPQKKQALEFLKKNQSIFPSKKYKLDQF